MHADYATYAAFWHVVFPKLSCFHVDAPCGVVSVLQRSVTQYAARNTIQRVPASQVLV